MNYCNFPRSSYGMCNRTAISRVVRLPLLTIILTFTGLVAAAEPTLEQACRPFTTVTATGPERSRASIPFGQAVFWRLEKADTTNYILGTLHSQDRQVTGLSPRQRLILARSSRLLVEIVPDAGSSQAYADAIQLESGPGLREHLSTPLYKRLQQIAGAYGLSPENLNELAPWAVFSQIGRPRPVQGPTQDMVIHDSAVHMGKPVIGLETMPELTETLSSLPYGDQITILKDTICNHDRIIRENKTLLDLYLSGDLAGMVLFNEQPHYDETVFDRFMEAVLHKRNQRMFERMLPYLEEGGSFIAVGALHLPDDNGLLQMLDEAGYRVTPIGPGSN